MAIRYNKAYNKEIRDAVKHAQTVEKTLSRRGIKLGIQVPKVSDLKARYQTRRELNKELTLLKKLSSSSDRLLKDVETSGGATAIKWGLDYLKLNQKKAIEFYENEKRIELESEPMFPGERMRLDEIEENLQILNMDVEYMNQEQFKTLSSSINDYLNMPGKQRAGYRGFLWQVENAMRLSGYDDETINTLFDKFKGLTPAQFHELYKKNDLIKRIYQLVNSPTNGNELKLTVEKEDARDIIDTLLIQADDDINSVK